MNEKEFDKLSETFETSSDFVKEKIKEERKEIICTHRNKWVSVEIVKCASCGETLGRGLAETRKYFA